MTKYPKNYGNRSTQNGESTYSSWYCNDVKTKNDKNLRSASAVRPSAPRSGIRLPDIIRQILDASSGTNHSFQKLKHCETSTSRSNRTPFLFHPKIPHPVTFIPLRAPSSNPSLCSTSISSITRNLHHFSSCNPTWCKSKADYSREEAPSQI